MWGCLAPTQEDPLCHDRLVYRFGSFEEDRCPLALLKDASIQQILTLYEAYDKGMTPNGRGLRYETAYYRLVIDALSRFDREAASSNDEPAKETDGGEF